MGRTRREFLGALWGAAGLAAGVGCSRSPRSGPERQARAASKRLGVALVGLGKYSSEQLAPALQKTKHCELRGIVTGSPDKIPRWQARYGITDQHVYDYASLPRIADDDAIDVVYIVVPTSLHARYAVLAASAGKHVWCEKPMAMTVDECQTIIDACRTHRVGLSIGYRMQHEPNTRTVMQYAADKPYGPITSVRALACHGGGASGWRLKREMGGGALYDMGVYAINGIRYASGEEPVRVLRASHATQRPELFSEVDETTEFELELPSGARAYGRTSVGEDSNALRVEARDGWYELSPMQRYHGVQGRTSDGKALDVEVDSQQALQMDDDALALLEGRPLMVPGEEGLRDIRIVQAVLQAAKTGAPAAI